MAEVAGTVDALAELIAGAKLTPEQRSQLLSLSLRKSRPAKPRLLPGLTRHCNKGDKVTVIFPDGHTQQLTAWKVRSRGMRLSSYDIGYIEKCNANRYRSLVKAREALAKGLTQNGNGQH